ncbi:hypothetical protein HNR23_004914 [Nocardiopsis mwathae]|uniref:Uncharacterized protein n=1 Tax=Nocardiopsis mwathae TaxID=1472723 RepID=A0A7W9YMS4_9ACTN|nr:hypothetical protein [Nocardiopsis mwathae]MBB6174854.1 hypothetical protein [Nocardiopsis mwathae]
MLDLTPDEARCLRQLADRIVEATQDRAYWLSGARDTSLAILARATEWLGDACAQHMPAHVLGQNPGRTARQQFTCIRPCGHSGVHIDTAGHCWGPCANAKAEEPS